MDQTGDRHRLPVEQLDIARASFKEVLASDEHQDGKAQRILTAMTFLTAAAGFIFANVKDLPKVDTLMFPAFDDFTFVSFSFFLFVATMIAGTIFVLAALGPVFNIPSRWGAKPVDGYPKSLLFSQLITEKSRDEWMSYWASNSDTDLRGELVYNYAFEAYLLSEKISFKVSSMRWGKIFYKASLGFLGMLMIPVFTIDERIVYSVSAWLISGLVAQELVERATTPPAWDLRRLRSLDPSGLNKFIARNLLSLNFYFGFALLGWLVFLVNKGFELYYSKCYASWLFC